MDWNCDTERKRPKCKKDSKKFAILLATGVLLLVIACLRQYNISLEEFQDNVGEMKIQLNEIKEEISKALLNASQESQNTEKCGILKENGVLTDFNKQIETEQNKQKESDEESICNALLAEDNKAVIPNLSDEKVFFKNKKTCSELEKKYGLITNIRKKIASLGKDGRDENINKLIKAAFDIYIADKTGRADYAVHTAGGCIVNTRDTKSYPDEKSVFGIDIIENPNGPLAMIQPSVHVGQCWSFRGSNGAAVIQLISPIFISGATVEHIPKEISPSGDISSAPKQISIWGLSKPDDNNGICIGMFVFDKTGDPLQYFELNKVATAFQFVEVMIHSNHGNKLYTCVYRVRIHGTPEEKSANG